MNWIPCPLSYKRIPDLAVPTLTYLPDSRWLVYAAPSGHSGTCACGVQTPTTLRTCRGRAPPRRACAPPIAGHRLSPRTPGLSLRSSGAVVSPLRAEQPDDDRPKGVHYSYHCLYHSCKARWWEWRPGRGRRWQAGIRPTAGVWGEWASTDVWPYNMRLRQAHFPTILKM